MKLIKELYIHNSISFTDTEVTMLLETHKIVSEIQQANIHSCGKDDTYLHEICNNILAGIAELLDNYSNEYAGE